MPARSPAADQVVGLVLDRERERGRELARAERVDHERRMPDRDAEAGERRLDRVR